ncbi:MAG: TIGR02186 family protein [Hyphomonadaceae bacterium]|nr:TIGR02186 family protein [Hyphomonadaceae bacterium]
MTGLFRIILAVLACALAWVGAPARAQNRGRSAAGIDEAVLVTSSFNGARVTIFGTAPTSPSDLDVVVLVRGPDRPAWIGERQRFFGLWLGQKRLRFDAAPTYFGVASAKPLGQVAAPDTLALYGLTPESQLAVQAGDTGMEPEERDRLMREYARLRAREGLYVADAAGVQRLPGGLFRADLQMPDTTAPGLYTAKVMVFRNGRQLDSTLMTLVVSKIGLERVLYRFARNSPALHALLGVALALGAGFVASRVLRRVSVT